MKSTAYLAIFCALGCNTTQKISNKATTDTVVDPTVYANSITQQELKTHLYTYASDAFQGRLTGEPGQKKAVAFLKEYYQKKQIKAAKKDGDYYQKVPLEKQQTADATLIIQGQEFTMGEHFVSFSSFKTHTKAYTEVVYMGYGIKDDAYSDYTNENLKGKLLLIKAGEPKKKDGTFVISGTQKSSKWGTLTQGIAEKVEVARNSGAAGVVFYDAENFNYLKNRFALSKKDSHSKKIALKKETTPFFTLYVDTEIAKNIYDDIASVNTPKTLHTNITTVFDSSKNEVDSENVIAFIPGTEKPEEYIVISAHLDHVGMEQDGQVFNGADDDGSGTVAILEIAEAFKKAAEKGNGPKRSLVFLHVTGEEKGLLGSDYYTQKPIFPLKNTVANLNIDMIGRIDPKREGDRNYIYLIGSDKLSTELHEVSEAVNKKYTNVTLDYTYNDPNDPNRFYYRSDHYNFAKHNVPVIFYFNGTHEDYHRVSDTPDKINYDLLENRTKLIFYTAWELANRADRIVVDKATK